MWRLLRAAWAVKTAVTVGILGLAGYAGYRVFSSPSAPADPVDPVLARVATDLGHGVAEKLPLRPDVASLYFPPIRGDAGAIRQKISERIRASGKFRIVDRSPANLTLDPDSALGWIRRWIEGDPDKPIPLKEALDQAERSGIEGILFGRVTRFRNDPEACEAHLEVGLYEVKGRKPILLENLSSGIEKRWYGPRYYDLWISGVGFGWRLLGWLVFVLALPWLLIPLVRAVLERESNAATLALLVGLTVVSGALLFLLTPDAGSWGRVLILIVGLGLAGGYAYGASSRIEECMR